MPAPSTIRPVERGADAAFAVGEGVADPELERGGVGAGADRGAAEAAVGELELTGPRVTRSVDGGGVAAHDEPLDAVVLGGRRGRRRRLRGS